MSGMPGVRYKYRRAVLDGGWRSIDGWVAPCCYCERLFPVCELTWEHVVPRALGGADDWRQNLRLACRGCNEARGRDLNALLSWARRLIALVLAVAMRRERMRGRRLEDGVEIFAPGDYGKVAGIWHARPPRGHLGSLADHQVTEHEDGTITVSPSILITYRGADGEETWHGFLERGVWREA